MEPRQMKKVRSWSTVVVLALALAAPSIAMAWGRGGKGGKNWEDRPFPPPDMVEDLKLTKDQETKLKEIHEKYKEEFKSLRKEKRKAREELKDVMESDANDSELRKKFEEIQGIKQKMGEAHFSKILEIREVLTKDQRKEFRKAMKEKRGRRGPPDRDGPPMDDDE